jgi:hypothetical protein
VKVIYFYEHQVTSLYSENPEKLKKKSYDLCTILPIIQDLLILFLDRNRYGGGTNDKHETTRQATTTPGNIYQFKKVSQTRKMYFH